MSDYVPGILSPDNISSGWFQVTVDRNAVFRPTMDAILWEESVLGNAAFDQMFSTMISCRTLYQEYNLVTNVSAGLSSSELFEETELWTMII